MLSPIFIDRNRETNRRRARESSATHLKIAHSSDFATRRDSPDSRPDDDPLGRDAVPAASAASILRRAPRLHSRVPTAVVWILPSAAACVTSLKLYRMAPSLHSALGKKVTYGYTSAVTPGAVAMVGISNGTPEWSWFVVGSSVDSPRAAREVRMMALARVAGGRSLRCALAISAAPRRLTRTSQQGRRSLQGSRPWPFVRLPLGGNLPRGGTPELRGADLSEFFTERHRFCPLRSAVPVIKRFKLAIDPQG
ncbi:hypothetical protein THAOC_32008 [Thalassiosira oceanica]|uniref:Uncharacterized protein n=1 Tax=Thalassiosira oceanica TaxID=159749 RepID=K0RJX2_THAOC|nr:hypothetical protein THAOC_32008 [Thalassiosira oceanica]|eukprot:EJK49146.1 hypothetical protein THAOC_32008 [Thalassiosira oceanica]